MFFDMLVCSFDLSAKRMTEQSTESFLPPSKRAARRILQRAFVLTGRDRPLRQHIRAARFTTLWILEDWDLVWTVIIDRGKIEFERRPARHPDLILSWPTANEFFASASLSLRSGSRVREVGPGAFAGEIPRFARNDTEQERNGRERDLNVRNTSGWGGLPGSLLESVSDAELRRVVSHLLTCFLGYLGHVLRNPVDGAGESLL